MPPLCNWTLDVGRSSFALATARQVSACRAEAFGVGGLGVCQRNLDLDHEHEHERAGRLLRSPSSVLRSENVSPLTFHFSLLPDFWSPTSLARRSPAAAGRRRLSVRSEQSLISLDIMVIL